MSTPMDIDFTAKDMASADHPISNMSRLATQVEDAVEKCRKRGNNIFKFSNVFFSPENDAPNLLLILLKLSPANNTMDIVDCRNYLSLNKALNLVGALAEAYYTKNYEQVIHHRTWET
jgi:hypothetical protein